MEKEKEGKLFYEIDWNVVTHMAERMATNKHKYKPYNWKKEITPAQLEDLKQATTRHFIAFANGDYEDDNRPFGHIEAIMTNLMMINYQLRNYGIKKEN